MENSGIKVNVFDLKSGLTTYEGVDYVRITSKDYNLLVMLDYVPIIGEVDGNVDIKTYTGEVNIKHIKGAYMNSNNVFNLMIEEVTQTEDEEKEEENKDGASK